MPTKFEAHKVEVGELLRRDLQFQVPKYQRSFSWTEDECGKFIEDVLSVVNGEVIEYFMGSVVFCQMPNAYQIVDGQQRLAMFSLLALVVAESYGQSGHSKAS